MYKYSFDPSIKFYMNDLWGLGRRCFEDLDTDEKHCLTGLVIKDSHSVSIMEFITEHKESEAMMLDFARYLISYDMNIFPEDSDWKESHDKARDIFLEKIKHVATERARNSIDMLFEEMARDIQLEKASMNDDRAYDEHRMASR